jgi:hypothetical protein
MRISKKLLMIATFSFISGSSVNASEPQTQDDTNLLNFISGLKKVPKAAALQLARWMESTYATNHDLSDQLINIVNTEDTIANKTKAIEQLKQSTEQAGTDQNTSYFSNIRTMATAAAAFVITASIASYFYFMRPWTSSNQ